MKLDRFISDTDTTVPDFARKIDVTPTALTRYMKGERRPRPDIMDRIIKATGGRVLPNDFFSLASDGAV